MEQNRTAGRATTGGRTTKQEGEGLPTRAWTEAGGLAVSNNETSRHCTLTVLA